MQELKKKNGDDDCKKKERHIVTWTQEEDDILREQISIHGTENWTIITSRFKDKTTRQCRRRWYTYLNSDFKKGGWSPEEDMLLCEAQKIFGNRWTEIAKVVSGRTDNAVKNRFSTLCKKKAKYEALAKENATSFLNPNNKRVMSQDGSSETVAPTKRMRRAHMSDLEESKENTTTINQQLRPPFAVLVQNIHSGINSPRQPHVSNTKEVSNNAQNTKIQGTFLKKDDPKINALMQQAELLSSLALKVNMENTDQSLENAWKALQDFLSQNKESDIFSCRVSDIDFQVEDLKDLVDELRRSNDQNQPSWRQPDLYEDSSCSSDYSTGSTLLIHSAGDITEQTRAESGEFNQNSGSGFETIQGREENVVVKCKKEIHANQEEIFPSCDEQTNNEVVSASSSVDFSSPLQVTPLFRSLAAGIPSPQFSESERSFLLKTLGMESSSPNASLNPSQAPPCKRALLHIL